MEQIGHTKKVTSRFTQNVTDGYFRRPRKRDPSMSRTAQVRRGSGTEGLKVETDCAAVEKQCIIVVSTTAINFSHVKKLSNGISRVYSAKTIPN
mmetsp:Transcript_12178/g.25808  ORF Transcript_12178/g.25808 Transcript_12178/m.25808 type:complete len:94 (+) Transcript_12178:972-1253(+)